MSEKRRQTWKNEEESLLLLLWKEKFPRIREHKKNTHIYGEMAERLLQNGYNRSAMDVKLKIGNMKAKYR